MTGRTVAGVCWAICTFWTYLPLASASILAEYDFSGAPGDQASTPASWTASGLTATPIHRGFGLEALAGAGLLNSRAWTSGEVDRDSDYFEWTIAPASGVTLNIDQIAFGERRNAAGIRRFTLRSSLDGFASDVVTPIDVPDDGELRNQTLALGAAFDAIGSPVTFRLYGYLSEAFTGRWGIGNHQEAGVFRISGSIAVPDPEPAGGGGAATQTPEPAAATIWSLIVGIAAGTCSVRRWRQNTGIAQGPIIDLNQQK